MKTLILLLTLSFLMNCYTYQNAVTESNNSVFDQTKTYELQFNDHTKTLAKHLVENGENYTFTGIDGTGKTIRTDSVKMIRERKFSNGKTIGLTLGIIGVAALAVTAITVTALSDWGGTGTQ